MTLNSTLFRQTLLVFIISLAISCNQLSSKAKPVTEKHFISMTTIDTNRISVLSFKEFGFVLDSTYTETSLTQQDFADTDSLIQRCIYIYNKSFAGMNQQSYVLQDNYRQYVAGINHKGEKEVWINCFCSTDNDSWKKTLFVVFDGGSCYYRLKVNLTTKKYYGLGVNGEA